jgi:hypothetical protein
MILQRESGRVYEGCHVSDEVKRDEVLKRLLKTPPKPHVPSKKDLDDLAKTLGMDDPNANLGKKDRKKSD